MKPDMAGRLWRIQNGEVKGTKEETVKANQIEKWHFNRETAPQSWLDMHPLEEPVGSQPWWANI